MHILAGIFKNVAEYLAEAIAIALDPYPLNGIQFQVLNLDGDSYLDTSEAPKGLPRRPVDPDRILADFDADGDGQLSADEFPGPEAHFDNLDTDGDGL